MGLADKIQKFLEKKYGSGEGKKELDKVAKKLMADEHSGVYKDAAELSHKWALRMQEILEEELSQLKTYEGKAFLENTTIVCDTVHDKDKATTLIKFDYDKVFRWSMSTYKNYEPVFMPIKINCPKSTAAKEYVYDEWHNNIVRSTLTWHECEDAHFMQRAVERFNKEAEKDGNGIYATLGKEYNYD